jgi:hypothetical protein
MSNCDHASGDGIQRSQATIMLAISQRTASLWLGPHVWSLKRERPYMSLLIYNLHRFVD